MYKFQKGDKVVTRDSNTETVLLVNNNGNIFTVENGYSWPPDTLKIVQAAKWAKQDNCYMLGDYLSVEFWRGGGSLYAEVSMPKIVDANGLSAILCRYLSPLVGIKATLARLLEIDREFDLASVTDIESFQLNHEYSRDLYSALIKSREDLTKK